MPRSRRPRLRPRPGNIHAADQRAVLDAVGVDRCHLWGGCIGVAYNLKFIKENPDRVSAAVCQDVVGLVPGVNTRATFFAMFEPTVELAKTNCFRVPYTIIRTDLFEQAC